MNRTENYKKPPRNRPWTELAISQIVKTKTETTLPFAHQEPSNSIIHRNRKNITELDVSPLTSALDGSFCLRICNFRTATQPAPIAPVTVNDRRACGSVCDGNPREFGRQKHPKTSTQRHPSEAHQVAVLLLPHAVDEEEPVQSPPRPAIPMEL